MQAIRIRKCPVCRDVPLVRVAYEGFPVFKCPDCKGYLVEQRRVRSIERARGHGTEELVREAKEERQADSQEVRLCPRCHQRMQKRALPAPASCRVDVCESCRMVWFDGGELARLQLWYESTAKGRDEAALRERLKGMSPQRRAEFERNLKKLPRRGGESAAELCAEICRSMFLGKGLWFPGL